MRGDRDRRQPCTFGEREHADLADVAEVVDVAFGVVDTIHQLAVKGLFCNGGREVMVGPVVEPLMLVMETEAVFPATPEGTVYSRALVGRSAEAER